MDEGDIAAQHAQTMLEAHIQAQRSRTAVGPTPRADGMCAWCESAPALPGSACCGPECITDWEHHQAVRRRQGLVR